MTTIETLAQQRRSLADAEDKLGLNDLSHTERDLFYAASELAGICPEFTTGALISHPLATRIPRPTFFRALKALTECGRLVPAGSRGRYSIAA